MKVCNYRDDHGNACEDQAAAESRTCERHGELLRDWHQTMRRWNEAVAWYGLDDPRTLAHGQRGNALAGLLGIVGA